MQGYFRFDRCPRQLWTYDKLNDQVRSPTTFSERDKITTVPNGSERNAKSDHGRNYNLKLENSRRPEERENESTVNTEKIISIQPLYNAAAYTARGHPPTHLCTYTCTTRAFANELFYASLSDRLWKRKRWEKLLRKVIFYNLPRSEIAEYVCKTHTGRKEGRWEEHETSKTPYANRHFDKAKPNYPHARWKIVRSEYRLWANVRMPARVCGNYFPL